MFRKSIIIALFGLLPLVSHGQDLAISSTLVAPVSGCYLPNNSPVTIIIINTLGVPYGGTFDVSYSLNGGAPVVESITTFLPASGTYIYSFIATADLSGCQVHTLDFLLTVPGDVNLANNTLNTSVTSDCAAIAGSIVGPDTVCQGINSGNLTLVGFTGNVEDWIYSINGGGVWNLTGNTATTNPYSNINNQTLFWVLMGSPFGFCPDDSTEIDTIEVVSQSIGGNLPADFDVCDNGNGGQIDLTGYSGDIVNWEYSEDGGTVWNPIPNITDSLDFLNLTVTTIYHVSVQVPGCPAVLSTPITLTVIPGTIAGSLPASFDICDNGNGGTINLTGYLGSILNWEISQNNGSSWTTITNTSDALIYSGLTDTTMYQVLVQNGFCPPEYSLPITLTLVPGSDAGVINGEVLICNYVNDSSLEVNPVLGNVMDWIVSYDNGANWSSSGITDTLYPYIGLTTNLLVAAIIQQGACPNDTVYHGLITMPVGVTISPGVSIVEGDSTQVIASGGSLFSWYPAINISDSTISNPYVSPMVTTTYNAIVTDVNGCSDTVSVLISVSPVIINTAVIIPNLLTPNGDGFNDNFKIFNIDLYPDNELVIFNSYGQVIYTASPYNNEWYGIYGGANVPDGTYYYVLNLNDTTVASEPFQGIITIIGNDD